MFFFFLLSLDFSAGKKHVTVMNIDSLRREGKK